MQFRFPCIQVLMVTSLILKVELPKKDNTYDSFSELLCFPPTGSMGLVYPHEWLIFMVKMWGKSTSSIDPIGLESKKNTWEKAFEGLGSSIVKRLNELSPLKDGL